MDETKWLIWNLELGAWLRHKCRGYTNDLSGAGVFGYLEAVSIVRKRNRRLRIKEKFMGYEKGESTPRALMILLEN